MNETSKSKRLWGLLERSVLQGNGIDVGCGPDPVTPQARGFDVADGDANEITRYVHDQFDFVYASHCLEHMHDPRAAVLEWWKLVRPGGHLFFIVPDEDLYEQGVFPSRFNSDHKATFTISKAQSWSRVSVNVLDLASSLPGGALVSLVLQDQGYDRSLLKHGPKASRRWANALLRFVRHVARQLHAPLGPVERWLSKFAVVDQTGRPDAVAQIQCIVRRLQ
jgi:SAM-dependent methyltransferase